MLAGACSRYQSNDPIPVKNGWVSPDQLRHRLGLVLISMFSCITSRLHNYVIYCKQNNVRLKMLIFGFH